MVGLEPIFVVVSSPFRITVSFLSAENEDRGGGMILLFSTSSSSCLMPGVDDDDSCTTAQGVGKAGGILP